MAERARPILIALDGGSGSGKSTIALLVAETLGATLIQSDDFFAANIPDAGWNIRGPVARAADCIDWQRLRTTALAPLLAGKPARWQAFDFEAGQRPDGTYAMQTASVERDPTPVIVLDGLFSTRPELADLIDLSVLIDVPVAVRHVRLAAREDHGFLEAWHARWDEAEEYYLTRVRPESAFDLVIKTGS